MKIIALIAPALLSACAVIPPAKPPEQQPVEPSAPQPAETYRALGTEPGWTVSISPARIDYVGDYGETRISTPRPEPRTTFNGHRYEARTEGHTLVVDVTHGRCSDGMSDRSYPDTVMVIADGKTLRGCGGDALAPAGLSGTSWSIQNIAGVQVQGERASIAFSEGGRITGNSGCNQFSGDYRLSGETLTIPQSLASTLMACSEPLMAQENLLHDVLGGGTLQLRFSDGDTLVLTAKDGREILLRRAI